MKPVSYMAIVLCVMLLLTGCSSGAVDEEVNESVQNKTAVQNKTEPFTRNTKIEDVINAPSFDGFGRLLFPTDEYYYSGDTLEELGLTYYSHIDPDETVEIVNTLRERAADGQTIFYDIYTDEEKAAEPAKEDKSMETEEDQEGWMQEGASSPLLFLLRLLKSFLSSFILFEVDVYY